MLYMMVMCCQLFMSYVLYLTAQYWVCGLLYTADLADKAKEHDVTLRAFADDTQLYLHRCREDMTPTIS